MPLPLAPNEALGWLWFVLGMVTGAALGSAFQRDDFMGGYASWPRRLLRLGHVSFFGLGLINILFALSLPRVSLGAPWPAVASWALAVGALTMPACCAVAAWRRRAKPLFAVPVIALLLGASLTALGLFLSEVP